MRKLAMLIFAAMLTMTVSAAYAEPPDPCFYGDDYTYFLNPQPLPPG